MSEQVFLVHREAPGIFVLADGPFVVSPVEIVLLMAEAVSKNGGVREVGAELRAAFEASKARPESK